jgi:hypothetical protein
MIYSIKSRKTTNTVEAEYDERGILTRIEFQGGLELEAIEALLNHIPRQDLNLMQWHPDKFEVTLVPTEIKWDTFWEAYPKKVGKLAAAAQWAKLRQGDRARAIKMIPKYVQWCGLCNPPRAVCDPERYLKGKRFDDEFKF